jgi:hypothetical protein
MATEDIIAVSSVIGNVLEVIVIFILVKWLLFDKKQSKKRKPRVKKADVQVTVPTVVKVQNGDEEDG